MRDRTSKHRLEATLATLHRIDWLTGNTAESRPTCSVLVTGAGAAPYLADATRQRVIVCRPGCQYTPEARDDMPIGC